MRSFIIDTQDLWNDFVSFVKESKDAFDIVSFDLETNSVEEIKAQVWGIGLAFQDSEAFYLPLRDKEGNSILDENEVVPFVSNLLAGKKIIGHNLVYDVTVWKHRYSIDLAMYVHADTILMKHTLDEEPPFGLKEVAVIELGAWADKAQEELYASIAANGGSTTKTNLQMYKADTNVLGTYCCWDTLLVYKLFEKFNRRLEEQNLLSFFYDEEVMPLYREVTIPMKEKGIPIDVAYFEKLRTEITNDIQDLNTQILTDLVEHISEFERETLEEMYPVKKTGNFPKAYASYYGMPITSLAKKNIDKELSPSPEHPFYSEILNLKDWLQDRADLLGDINAVRNQMFFSKNPDLKSVFNLASKHHLKWLFFERLKETPLSRTEKGEPQVDDDFLESVSGKYEWVKKLQDLNKLEKIRGTYIEGLLERQHEGIIYTSFLQFGTTSGRFASRNPNLQNQPRPKEDDSGLSELVLRYNNAIRAGFVALPDHVFVDADQSALEPRCFSVESGDKNLQQIFHSGEDMYSSIAKRVFKLEDVSTFKKDANFLGKLHPEKRQIIKALALAVTYGAEAFRIADLLKVTPDEAQTLIDDYLNAYPGLKEYIKRCHYDANTKGEVRTMFGRVRHLPEAKNIFKTYGPQILNSRWARSKGLSDVRRLYKNKLNNATNFCIQGLAAHVLNKSMVAIARRFKEENVDGYLCLTVHDQAVCMVTKKDAERAVDIVRDCMENTVKLPVPLIAEPKIAYNLRDSH